MWNISFAFRFQDEERQRMSGVVPSVSWKCNSSQEMQIHIIIIKTSKGTFGFLKQCLQWLLWWNSPSDVIPLQNSSKIICKKNVLFESFYQKKKREIWIQQSDMINNHCVHLSLSRYHHMLHGNYLQWHFSHLVWRFRLLPLKVYIQ